MRLPHNTFRDWWHRPVLDRLDAIAEKLTKPDPVFYQLGVKAEDVPDRATARDLHEAMSGRGSWKPYPPARRPA